MAMLQRHSQSQRLQQRADPQLLLSNRVLQMTRAELLQCVEHEIAENPALETEEERACGHCQIPGPECRDCPFNPQRLQRLKQGDQAPAGAYATTTAVLEADPLEQFHSAPTLQEHLRNQLGAVTGGPLHSLGCYLIENLDADGYLRTPLEEVVRALACSPREVAEALELVQSLDPVGVGARSLQECLLLQVRDRKGNLEPPAHAETLLTRYWKELAAGKLGVIARGLRLSEPAAEALVRWVRSNLNPYPGFAFRNLWDPGAHRRGEAIRPDVFVTRSEEGLLVDISGEELPEVHLNAEYLRLLRAARQDPSAFGEAERRHLRDYVHRGQMFLKALGDRVTVLRRVAECLVDEQRLFFETEREEDLLPLTQARLASFLQVHESTVSRALAEKFVQLPSGSVLPLSFFFDRATSLRRLVANIVAAEDPSRPYSDQQIAEILGREGIVLARRTVMKYREELNILSSRQRTRIRS